MSDVVMDRLRLLVDCVCVTMVEEDAPPLCFCGIVPGVNIALDFVNGDDCDNADGMAWVRLMSVSPTVTFPVASVAETKCGSLLAIIAEIGVIRSMPIRSDGEPPDAATYQAVAEQQIADAAVLRKAVQCCFKTGVILGPYTPIGPAGGAVGGQITATFPSIDLDD